MKKLVYELRVAKPEFCYHSSREYEYRMRKAMEGYYIFEYPCPETLAQFEKKEDAMAELKKYFSTVEVHRSWNLKYLEITLYYVQEIRYSEDEVILSEDIVKIAEYPKYDEDEDDEDEDDEDEDDEE